MCIGGAASVDVAIHCGTIRAGELAGVEPFHSPDVSIGYNGGTCGGGVRSTGCSTDAGSVDGIDAVSVPVGVAMLMW